MRKFIAFSWVFFMYRDCKIIHTQSAVSIFRFLCHFFSLFREKKRALDFLWMKIEKIDFGTHLFSFRLHHSCFIFITFVSLSAQHTAHAFYRKRGYQFDLIRFQQQFHFDRFSQNAFWLIFANAIFASAICLTKRKRWMKNSFQFYLF